MKKECQFILLPTKEESEILLCNSDISLDCSYLQFDENCGKNYVKSSIVYQHLYILSDDEIKEGDWVYDNYANKEKVWKTNNGDFGNQNLKGCKKIIATTNKLIANNGFSNPNDSKESITVHFISQSDIESIISSYNEKGEEVNIKKLALEKYPYDLNNPENKWRREGYNQCLQDNADKKFTLEDIRAIVWKSNYLKGGFDKEGFSFYKDDNEIMDECIQSLTKEQSNNNTVMVEYESDGLPSKQIKIGDVDLTEFNDTPYKPKLKDGSIVIHQ